jgi:hypothetical protein
MDIKNHKNLIGHTPLKTTNDLGRLIEEISAHSTMDNILNYAHPFENFTNLVHQAIQNLQRGSSLSPSMFARPLTRSCMSSSLISRHSSKFGLLRFFSGWLRTFLPQRRRTSRVSLRLCWPVTLTQHFSADSGHPASDPVVQFDTPEVALLARLLVIPAPTSARTSAPSRAVQLLRGIAAPNSESMFARNSIAATPKIACNLLALPSPARVPFVWMTTTATSFCASSSNCNLWCPRSLGKLPPATLRCRLPPPLITMLHPSVPTTPKLLRTTSLMMFMASPSSSPGAALQFPSRVWGGITTSGSGGVFGHTGIDPEMVCYLDYYSNRTCLARPDPT